MRAPILAVVVFALVAGLVGVAAADYIEDDGFVLALGVETDLANEHLEPGESLAVDLTLESNEDGLEEVPVTLTADGTAVDETTVDLDERSDIRLEGEPPVESGIAEVTVTLEAYDRTFEEPAGAVVIGDPSVASLDLSVPPWLPLR